MKNLNILQVVNSPHWHAISSYALGLSKGLKDRGHKVIMATLSHSLLLERAIAEGLEVITNLRLNHYNPFYFFTDLKRMTRLLEEEEIDVLNVHESRGFVISCLAAKLARRPVVLIRTRGTFMAPKGYLINRYIHNSLADKVIVASQFMRQMCLRHLKGKKSHYLLIYGGVDTEYLKPCQPDVGLKQSLGIEKDAVVIGIIARFDPVKGHKYFFEAAGRLKKLGAKVNFLAIGYEAEFSGQQLLAMAEDCGVKKETVMVKEWSALPGMLSVVDIGIISSIGSEANSRALLEYMACGKPVVSTAVGVIPEILKNEVTGYLIPPENPEAMASALMKLLQNPMKAKEMGSSGRKIVEERFSQENLVLQTEKIYTKEWEKKWKDFR